MRVMTIVGARPQFIKAAVISHELRCLSVDEILVHTGQHYDAAMSDVFFRQLGLREPDHYLGIGSGPHGSQTGRMLAAIEEVLQRVAPARVIVYGDTNSTLAGALAAAKLHIAVDHVEAGLRSFDRDMPEEVNRVLTDRLSDQLFCPTRTAVENLKAEGIRAGVHLAGDVMLDLALRARSAALETPLPADVRAGEYFVATVHRAANTDDGARLERVVAALGEVSRRIAPVVLPVHPRLAQRLTAARLALDGLQCIEPVGYLEMQGLILRARAVITDSGGVQKEALFHGVPCLTLRDTTEWTESVAAGMNVLVGDDVSRLPMLADACHGRAEVPAAIFEAFGGGRAASVIAGTIRATAGARRRWGEGGDSRDA
jgi:UDP-GlcNAc3NAcA epimerase